MADTLSLVPKVKGVILCVRLGQTTRDQAIAAKDELRRLPERPVGLVLTDSKPGSDYDYAGYYSSSVEQPPRWQPRASEAMSSAHSVLVSGGGGFIGGYLVSALLADGAEVRAVDVKPVEEWHQHFDGVENLQLDLRLLEDCRRRGRGNGRTSTTSRPTWGAWGSSRPTRRCCMLSVLINTHLLQAAREQGADRYFFASSACVYAATSRPRRRCHPCAKPTPIRPCQRTATGGRSSSASGCAATSRRTSASRPGSPGTTTSMARTGPVEGGREKAPAAICRKVAEAKLSGNHEIEIWGDGKQTRSFTYIDDCVQGTRRLMDSDVERPINIGSSELVTINELIDLVERISPGSR